MEVYIYLNYSTLVPFLQYQDGGEYVIKVWNFEQIKNVLQAAGEKKCREVQACLEGKI